MFIVAHLFPEFNPREKLMGLGCGAICPPKIDK